MNTKLPVSILVTYNNMELEGIDTFIGGLKTNYSVVKAKPKWLPKACEGGEVWLDIIADINLIDTLKNYITNKPIDLLFDALLLRPLLNYLKNLATANENTYQLRVLYLKLQYNDIDIKIGGLNRNRLPIIHAVFKSLIEKLEYFERETEIEISEVQTPMLYLEHTDYGNPYVLDTLVDFDDVSIDKYLNMWRIIYGGGVENRIYDFKNNTFYQDNVKKKTQ